MANVGTLAVNVVAKTGGFNSGLRIASASTTKFSTKIAGAAKKVASLGLALGGVGSIAGIGMMVKKQFALIDSSAKLARQVGMTVDELMGLRHAAELTGAGADSMDAGLQTFAKRLGEAARGGGAASAALKEMGLDAKALQAKTLGAAFTDVAGAMSKFSTTGERNAIAANLFSKANQRLLLTLDLGAAGLSEMHAESIRLNGSLSEMDTSKIEAANDAITRMGGSFSKVFRSLAIDLAPIVEMIATGMTGEFQNANDELDEMGSKFSVVGEGFDMLVNSGHTFRMELKYIKAGALGLIAVLADSAADAAENYLSVAGSDFTGGVRENALQANVDYMKALTEAAEMRSNPPSKAFRDNAAVKAQKAAYDAKAAKEKADRKPATIGTSWAASEPLNSAAKAWAADSFAAQRNARFDRGMGQDDGFQKLLDAMNPIKNQSPGFAPAMERGSLQAYDTIQRNMQKTGGPAEATAKASEKLVAEALKQTVLQNMIKENTAGGIPFQVIESAP